MVQAVELMEETVAAERRKRERQQQPSPGDGAPSEPAGEPAAAEAAPSAG